MKSFSFLKFFYQLELRVFILVNCDCENILVLLFEIYSLTLCEGFGILNLSNKSEMLQS